MNNILANGRFGWGFVKKNHTVPMGMGRCWQGSRWAGRGVSEKVKMFVVGQELAKLRRRKKPGVDKAVALWVSSCRFSADKAVALWVSSYSLQCG